MWTQLKGAHFIILVTNNTESIIVAVAKLDPPLSDVVYDKNGTEKVFISQKKE